MKTPRQIVLKKYLTAERKKIFKMNGEELMVYDIKGKQWLPYPFTKKQMKKGIKYFRKYDLERDVYQFLLKHYNDESITGADVRGIIKLLPFEIN